MWQKAAFTNRLFIAICLILFMFTNLHGGEKESLRVAILISIDIKPYIEAAEAISKILDKYAGIEAYLFSIKKGRDRDDLKEKIGKKEIALMIAIGPESLMLAESNFQETKIPVIYTMVLNPEKNIGNMKSFCGIPFNIPASAQIRQIARALPGLKRIELLYDPVNNESFFKQAFEEAKHYSIELIPLKVSSPKELTSVLKEKRNAADALWMIPDSTIIISDSVIQHIIREALSGKIPVIGYNRFFYESGAALSFVFDYEEIGEQTAKLASEVLTQKTCADIAPIFHVWLNSRIMRKLGIPLTNKESFPIEIKP